MITVNGLIVPPMLAQLCLTEPRAEKEVGAEERRGKKRQRGPVTEEQREDDGNTAHTSLSVSGLHGLHQGWAKLKLEEIKRINNYQNNII